MAHKEQIEFIKKIKQISPDHFKGKIVLDVGSYDVNGNNRRFFEKGTYIGLDIIPGPNVNTVRPVHTLDATKFQYDVVICTEMLEHDRYWKESIINMVKLVKPGGILIITCATTGRLPHGVRSASPDDSLGTLDYYHNITTKEFHDALHEAEDGMMGYVEVDIERGDLYYYGEKI